MDDESDECKPGLPAYMGTFADLMSLLMCFFVLLLSFAEMDATKFKQIAQSLEKAFGVQRQVAADQIPMGTSPVFDKFSPGKPEPTVLDEVRQQTSQQDPRLATHSAEALQQVQQALQQQLERSAQQLAQALQQELGKGLLQLEQGNKRLVVRIEERGSFPSGSAEVTPAFRDMLRRIAQALAAIPGEVAVEGHTDDVPIRTARFQSNWDLSAARAAAVANALLEYEGVAPQRLRVAGYAETRPLVPNDSAEQRARNRRVEIVIDLAGPAAAFEAEALQLLQAGGDLSKLGWRR